MAQSIECVSFDKKLTNPKISVLKFYNSKIRKALSKLVEESTDKEVVIDFPHGRGEKYPFFLVAKVVESKPTPSELKTPTIPRQQADLVDKDYNRASFWAIELKKCFVEAGGLVSVDLIEYGGGTGMLSWVLSLSPEKQMVVELHMPRKAPNTADTPIWGSREKNPEQCRCETGTDRSCGCAFGQCAKGLIY